MTQGLDIGSASGTKDLTLAEVSNAKGSIATAEQGVDVGKVSTHHPCYRVIDFKAEFKDTFKLNTLFFFYCR